MSVFSNILDSLSEYEDDDLWKTLHDLYGPLLQFSLLFPSFRHSQRPLTYVLFVVYSIILLGHVGLLAVTVVMVSGNISLFSLLFQFLLMMLYAVFAIVQFSIPYYRKSCAMNHLFLARDIGKYQHGRIYDEDAVLKIQRDLHVHTLRLLIVPGFIGIGAVTLFILPYINNFNSDISYTDNCVSINLPIPAYYPFRTDNGVGHFVALGGQALAALGLATVMVASAFMLLRVAVRLRFEHKVLNYALETLFQRAFKVHKTHHPGREITTLKDAVFQQCVGACLKECVVHHQDIVKLLEGFAVVTRWPAAATYGIGCLGMALSLRCLLLALSVADHENTIMFSLIIVGEILVLLMVSVIGESVTSDSKELRDKLYNIEWYDINVKNRELMLNFQVGVNKPVVMKAGVNTTISLDTYSNIINTAYSFFNVMNANME